MKALSFYLIRALGLATLYSVWVVVGSLLTSGRGLRLAGLTLAGVLIFYYGGAIVVSVVLWMLQRYLATMIGAFTVAFIAALPLMLCLGLTLFRELRPRQFAAGALIGSAALAGIFVINYWTPPER